MHRPVSLPAQPLRHKAHTGGGEHAPNGEDGHRQGPEGGEGPRGDGLSIPMNPCGVIVFLDDLRRAQGVSKNFTKQQSFQLAGILTGIE